MSLNISVDKNNHIIAFQDASVKVLENPQDYIESIAVATRTNYCPVRNEHLGTKKKRTEYLVPVDELERDVEYSNNRAKDIDPGHANELAEEFEVVGQTLGSCVLVKWDASMKRFRCFVLWGNHRYEAVITMRSNEVSVANLPVTDGVGHIWVSFYDVDETPESKITTLQCLENDLHPTARRNSFADRVNSMKLVWIDRKDEIFKTTGKLAVDCTDKERETHFFNLAMEALPKATPHKVREVWEKVKQDPAMGASKTKSYTKASCAEEFCRNNPYWDKDKFGGKKVGVQSLTEFQHKGKTLRVQGWVTVEGVDSGALIQQTSMARNVNNNTDYNIIVSSPIIPADSSQSDIDDIRLKEAQRFHEIGQNISGVFCEKGSIVDEIIYTPCSVGERKSHVTGYAVRYAVNPKTNEMERVPDDNKNPFPFL